MVARHEADWETRLWNLTHDLVVRMAPSNDAAGIDHQSASIECLQMASMTVSVYRAAVERSTES